MFANRISLGCVNSTALAGWNKPSIRIIHFRKHGLPCGIDHIILSAWSGYLEIDGDVSEPHRAALQNQSSSLSTHTHRLVPITLPL